MLLVNPDVLAEDGEVAVEERLVVALEEVVVRRFSGDRGVREVVDEEKGVVERFGPVATVEVGVGKEGGDELLDCAVGALDETVLMRGVRLSDVVDDVVLLDGLLELGAEVLRTVVGLEGDGRRDVLACGEDRGIHPGEDPREGVVEVRLELHRLSVDPSGGLVTDEDEVDVAAPRLVLWGPAMSEWMIWRGRVAREWSVGKGRQTDLPLRQDRHDVAKKASRSEVEKPVTAPRRRRSIALGALARVAVAAMDLGDLGETILRRGGGDDDLREDDGELGEMVLVDHTREDGLLVGSNDLEVVVRVEDGGTAGVGELGGRDEVERAVRDVEDVEEGDLLNTVWSFDLGVAVADADGGRLLDADSDGGLAL